MPTVDDAETGLLYIKMPEKELYYLLEEPTKQWIRFSSNAVLNSTDGTILINTTDNVYELSAAPTFTASKNYTDLKIKDFYNKTESDNKFMLKAEISSVYMIKGSKANFNEINNLTTKEKGDVYNAQDTGMNYVWTGDEWDALGSTIDLTNYYIKTEADDKFVEKINGKTLTSNDFTNELKAKLEGISNGANKNIQPDWNQTDNSKDDFIKNKPVIPTGSILYSTTGTNANGAMTQKAVTD